MRRLLIGATLASIMLGWGAQTVVAIGCSTTYGVHFSGNTFSFPDDPDGVSARIEYVNPQLCTGFNPNVHGGSFSSYWIALGNASDPFNIFQVGVDECQGPGCVQANSPYYFYALGWEAGPICGNERPPVAKKAPKGNATGGMPLFTIVRNSSNSRLEARIDGAVQYSVLWSTVVTCWGGTPHGSWLREVFNFGDQAGGPNGNRQNFEDVIVHLGGSWRDIDGRALNCSVPSSWAHMKCDWSNTELSKFWQWDTRF